MRRPSFERKKAAMEFLDQQIDALNRNYKEKQSSSNENGKEAGWGDQDDLDFDDFAIDFDN